jgi:hypothetical protein
MTVSFVFGDNVVVSSEELNEKMSLGTIASYEQSLQRDPDATIEFRNGIVGQSMKAAGAGPLPFEPVGIGNPLSLEILGYYTGDLPAMFGFKLPGMLVSSAFKAIEMYDAQAKAVNQIVKEVSNRQYLRPSAEAEGTPIVLYTPALVPDTSVVDLTMAIDRFDEELFQYMAALFKSASGLPLFFVPGPQGAIASTALLAGSVVADKAGRLGKVLFNSKTILRDNVELRFDTPGFFALQPGPIFAKEYKDRAEFVGFTPTLVDGGTPQQHMVLRNEAGQDYAGYAPYIILNLDGRRRGNLTEFKTRAATSAILEQFVGSQDAGRQAVALLEQAMSLLNDATFREKALATQTRLEKVNASISDMKKNKVKTNDIRYRNAIDEQDKLVTQLEAYKGNIRDAIFNI